MSLTTTYTTTESTNSSQTGSITIAKLTKVDSITVNTGNVTYTVSGTTINMSFSGGAWERRTSYTYSYDCTASPSSKTASASSSGTRANWQQWNGSSWVYAYSTNDAPTSYSYNDGSYSGTLPRTSLYYGTPTYYTAPSNPTVGQMWHNSDTAWNASYSGTVNAISKTCTGTGYTYYYQYVATINYETDNPPNLPTFANLTSSGYTINKRPKLIVNLSDPDAVDTITNVEIQIATDSAFTSLVVDAQYANDSGYGTQTVGFSGMPTPTNTGTINWTPQADLPVGTLYARVRAKDNSGTWSGWSTTQQFAIANAPWTDTVPANANGYPATWVNDIATVLNQTELFRGLTQTVWTDGTLSNVLDIKAQHISERRASANALLNIVGITPTWTDPDMGSAIDRKGQHIIELRNYCLQM